jgi:hypothetical protein
MATRAAGAQDGSASAKTTRWVSSVTAPLYQARRELELASADIDTSRLSALIQRRGLSPDAAIVLAAHPVVDMLASSVDPDVAVGLAGGLINPVDLLFAPRRLLSPRPRSQPPAGPQALAGAPAQPPAAAAATHPANHPANHPAAQDPELGADSADTLLAHLWWGAGQAQLNAVRSWFAGQASAPADADGRAASPAAAPPAGLPAEAALTYAAAVLERCRPPAPPARVLPQGPRMPALPPLLGPPAGSAGPAGRQLRPPPPPPPPGLQLMAADLLVRLLAAHPGALVEDSELCDDLLPALLQAAQLLLEHAAPAPAPSARERAAAAAALPVRAPSPRGRTPSPPPLPAALPSKADARGRLAALCGALEARGAPRALLELALSPLQPSACAAAAALQLLRLLCGAGLLRDPLLAPAALAAAQRLWHATCCYARPAPFEGVAQQLQEDLAGVLACFRPQVRGRPACRPAHWLAGLCRARRVVPCADWPVRRRRRLPARADCRRTPAPSCCRCWSRGCSCRWSWRRCRPAPGATCSPAAAPLWACC